MSGKAIDLLGWVPLNQRLRGSLERAFAHASAERSTDVGVQHLLAAFAEDVDVNVYLAGSGAAKDRVAAIFQSPTKASADAERANGAATARIGDNGYFYTRDEDQEDDRLNNFGMVAGSGSLSAGRQDGYDAGYAGTHGFASRAEPVPSAALRRLMAHVSSAAEALSRQEVSGELVLQVMAVQGELEAGRQLASVLPKGELARLKASLQPQASESAPKPKKNAGQSREAAFKTLFDRLESLLMTLHGELQKDMRYRLVNDLQRFLADRGAEGASLQHAASPLLDASRAELDREPQYLAMERLRGTLRNLRYEEQDLKAAFADLMRHGRLEPGAALTRAAEALVELPAPGAVSDGRLADAAAQPLPPQPMVAAEARPMPEPTPILHRVLDTMRPGARKIRRKSDASEANGRL